MAKKKDKGGGVKQAIREAGPKISKKELNRIVEAAGSTSAALNKIASVQQSMKQADKAAPSIGSAAANMLIKQAQSTPAGVYQLGTSKLAGFIRGMAGTPAGPMIQGQRTPATPLSGLGYVPPGMVIRPSGRLATGPLKGRSAQTTGSSPYDGMMTGEESDPNGPGPFAPQVNEPDWRSYIDDLFSSIQMPEMPQMPDFESMFADLSSQFDTMNPLQLAQLGKAYGSDAIRARQRNRRTRADYRRGLPNMLASATPALASMGIGGGVTL